MSAALCFSVTPFRRQLLCISNSNHEEMKANTKVDCISCIFRERERSQMFVVSHMHRVTTSAGRATPVVRAHDHQLFALPDCRLCGIFADALQRLGCLNHAGLSKLIMFESKYKSLPDCPASYTDRSHESYWILGAHFAQIGAQHCCFVTSWWMIFKKKVPNLPQNEPNHTPMSPNIPPAGGFFVVDTIWGEIGGERG